MKTHRIAFRSAALLFVAAGLVPIQSTPAQSAVTADAINAAAFEGQPLASGQSALAAKVQVLLDRAGISPGVIDGFDGENVEKALMAFERINGFEVDGQLDADVWAALQAHGGEAGAGSVIVSHQLTDEDVSRIVEKLPEDYAELAELDWLGYTTVDEKLAEMFHMDVDFLRLLNPDAGFATGDTIQVADIGRDSEVTVARLVADKALARLLAYDEADNLVLSYPVTIGSDGTPSPSGTHEVTAVAIEPTYSYNPDVNFQQGDNDEPLTLPPGPNGPVGTVWIDLSKPTYGIHGTPDPAKIGKTASHGCVRMTNWDARELAHLVEPGVTVSFQD